MNEEAKSQAPKSKTKLIVIIVVVLNVVGIAGAAFFLMGGKSEKGAEEDPAAAFQKGNEPGPLIDLQPFVVNIDSPAGTGYLKVGVTLELPNQQTVEHFEKVRMLARNEVLMHLSSLATEDTKTKENKVELQNKLRDAINKRLGREFVITVLFTEFVTQ